MENLEPKIQKSVREEKLPHLAEDLTFINFTVELTKIT